MGLHNETDYTGVGLDRCRIRQALVFIVSNISYLPGHLEGDSFY